MPRQGISTAMQGWLEGTVLPAAWFFEGTFASGPAYLWSGVGTITWNGHTWQGIGTLGAISAIEEGVTVEAKGLVVTLSGFDPTLLADVVGEVLFGQPAAVYLAGFTDGSLIADPLAVFVGLLDSPSVSVEDAEGGPVGRISINCESPFLDLNVAVDRRYTQEDQQRENPGDLAFSFVYTIQEVAFYVGQAPTTAGNI